MKDEELQPFIGKEVKAEVLLYGEINEYCGVLEQSVDSGLYSVVGTKSIYGITAYYFESISILKC